MRGTWFAAAALALPILMWALRPSAPAAVAPAGAGCATPPNLPDVRNPQAGMVSLQGGDFAMGAAPVRDEEGPPHKAHVAPFWIDRTDVTNAQFAKFVAATGYRTLAERGLDPRQYPNLTPQQRQPASLVFVGADAGVSLADPSVWWRVIPGADWRHPTGPGSSIAGLENAPVVHVAWDDAAAYAHWLGHTLPSEAQWEYAARGGLRNGRYAWGDAENPGGKIMAHVWQGEFPSQYAPTDPYGPRPAPVGCFPPNGFGLYDMAGNVWQWTRDPSPAESPDGPSHIIKGGSFLCSSRYCFRYRPAARIAGPPDSGASHIGFRTVWSAP